MRTRRILLALSLLPVLLLSGCGMLSTLDALSPRAISDAFEPYQSTSPDGAWVLDVRKVEDEIYDMSFAAIRVLSAETGEVLYDCPGRWRFWDLHGIDWLCDGTILVDSSDTGAARYGSGTDGAWQLLGPLEGLATSLPPVYDDGYARIYEQDGWRTIEVRGDDRWAYISFDAGGKTRLDMLHSNLTLAELEDFLAEKGAEAVHYSALHGHSDEGGGVLRYLTEDLYSVTIRDFAIEDVVKLPPQA